MSKLNHLLEYTDYHEVYHLYVRKILSKIFLKVGVKALPDEDHQSSLLRSLIFGFLVSVNDPQVSKEAKSMFESHVNKISLIPANLRQSVYRSIAKECDDKTFETFFQLYRESDLQEEKNRIVYALGSTTCVSRIHRIIDFAMSVSILKTYSSIELLIKIFYFIKSLG